ncbi:Alpha/Beta hydrolase protein [Boeremia exigua]|uniref:Alpha/Beta hydrolase protein n=1 Tax=Boeremia exigua TaxID=749465 RepID=UPI001E8CEC25|nr:Alpha/Beta hydrolase protein [Boeremia exigua]KAH6643574.1 Alpha/Beta hydrolase protein [Boeremia exigua]
MSFPHPGAFETVPRRETEEVHRDGYKLIKDVYISTRDGSELCGNVYLPTNTDVQKFPVLLTMGPYGKDIHFSEFGKPKTDMYANMAKAISPLGPDACFETPDPIVWCKSHGYTVVRIDVRGSGGSPGVLDPFGIGRTVLINDDSEGRDLYDVVEWAGTQEWSTGKVAMCGISYYGMACYWAAMQQPPHLSAIVPYEALADMYGDAVRQGGVWHSGFQKHWYNNIVVPEQYGKKEGLSEEQLAKQRFDYDALATNWIWRKEGPWPILDRTRDLSKIKVPMLTAGNWMDSELHLPGNPTSYERASSEWKFLEMHTGNHLAAYYEPEQIHRQLEFLDHFLKNKTDNGLKGAPRVDLLIRKGTENFYRAEKAWPPTDAKQTPLYFAPNESLSFEPYKGSSTDAVLSYAGLTGVNFFQTEPLQEKLEILGFPHLDLTVSTDAKDMDLFFYFYVIDPKGEKLVFRGNHDEPAVSFLRSWFRLSHRTLSNESTPNRPILNQMGPAAVEAGQWYDVKVPIVCTSMIVEPGHRLAIGLRANDEEDIIPPMRHIGPDRPEAIFSGTNRIKLGGKLVLPIVKRV